jgi:hypothetical protein
MVKCGKDQSLGIFKAFCGNTRGQVNIANEVKISLWELTGQILRS